MTVWLAALKRKRVHEYVRDDSTGRDACSLKLDTPPPQKIACEFVNIKGSCVCSYVLRPQFFLAPPPSKRQWVHSVQILSRQLNPREVVCAGVVFRLNKNIS